MEPSWNQLTLAEILDWLVEDKLVEAEPAEKLRKERRYYRGTMHPLVIVADQKWKTARRAHSPLTLEALTEWLAKRVGMEYLHIDPLKIDFAGGHRGDVRRPTRTRFRILPVARQHQGGGDRHRRAAACATGSPSSRASCKREIRRVIANPADIERYQVEFYNLAKSIKGAEQRARRHLGPVATSSSWSSSARRDKQLDANDAHIVRIVDWLWQYAFEQRASDIHIEPRRELGIVRFRIDGVLHQVYQIPAAVLAAMTSRIKILGAHGRGREAPAAGRPHQDAHAATATRSSCACRRCRPRSARSW